MHVLDVFMGRPSELNVSVHPVANGKECSKSFNVPFWKHWNSQSIQFFSWTSWFSSWIPTIYTDLANYREFHHSGHSQRSCKVLEKCLNPFNCLVRRLQWNTHMKLCVRLHKNEETSKVKSMKSINWTGRGCIGWMLFRERNMNSLINYIPWVPSNKNISRKKLRVKRKRSENKMKWNEIRQYYYKWQQQKHVKEKLI